MWPGTSLNEGTIVTFEFQLLDKDGVSELTIVELLVAGVTLADEHNEGSITVWGTKLSQVDKPTWDGNLIKWDGVEHPGLGKYKVTLYKGGTEVTSAEVNPGVENYDFTSAMDSAKPGKFTATVQALAATGYDDGDPSAASDEKIVSVKLGTVGKPTWGTGWTITWNDLAAGAPGYGDHVESYLVNLEREGHGSTVASISMNPDVGQLDLESFLAGPGSYSVTVLAKAAAGDELYTDGNISPQSEPKVLVGPLPDVTGLEWHSTEAGVITWDAVFGAEGYHLRLHDITDAVILEDSVPGNAVEYDILDFMRTKGAGVYYLSIKALGDGVSTYHSNNWENSSTKEIIQLAAPDNLDLSDAGLATWDEVANNNGYQVEVCKGIGYLGGPYTAGTNEYDLETVIRNSKAGEYYFKVKAMGTGYYLTSDFAELPADNYLNVQLLSPPFVTSFTNGIVNWEAVSNVHKYYVCLISEGEIDPVFEDDNVASDVTSYNMLEEMRKAPGNYSVKTRALADPSTVLYLDSDFVQSTYCTVQALPDPTGPNWDGETLKWTNLAGDAAAAVNTYRVQLRRGGVDYGAPLDAADGAAGVDFSTLIAEGGAGYYSAVVTAIAKTDTLYLDSSGALSGEYKKTGPLGRVDKPSFQAGVVTWDDIGTALSYKVRLYDASAIEIDSQTVAAGVKSHSFIAAMKDEGPGAYYATVQALGAGLEFFTDGLESVPSDTCIQLAKVAQPALDGMGVATWTAVDDAVSYSVQLYKNGSPLGAPVTSASPCDLLAAIRAGGMGSYTVRVTAMGNGAGILDGEQSDSSDPREAKKLDQVGRPDWVDAPVIEWEHVSGAPSYLITIYHSSGQTWEQTVDAGPGPSQNCELDIPYIQGFYWVTVQAKGEGLTLDGEVSPASRYLVAPDADEEEGLCKAEGLLELFRKLFLRFTCNEQFLGLMDVQFSAGHATGVPAGKKGAGLFLTLDYLDAADEFLVIGYTQENGDGNGDENGIGNGANFSALIRVYLDAADIEGLKKETLRLYRLENGSWVQLPQSGISSDAQGDYVWAEVDSFSDFGIFGDAAPAGDDEKPVQPGDDEKKPLPKTWGLVGYSLFAGLLITAAGILLRRLRFARR